MSNWYHSVKNSQTAPQVWSPEIQTKLRKIEYFINAHLEHDQTQGKQIGLKTIWHCINQLITSHGVEMTRPEIQELIERITKKYGLSDDGGIIFEPSGRGKTVVSPHISGPEDWDKENTVEQLYTKTPTGYIFNPPTIAQSNGDAIARQVWEMVQQQIPEPQNRSGKYLEYTIQHILRETFHIPDEEIPKIVHMVKKHKVEDSYLDMPDGSQAKYPWTNQQQQQAFNR